ncbi:Glutathione S-transferase U7 [Senna tora]|uniref:Glutathione S-transferase U7 n=1 Tax=Senna tora TaxID=362788 RepID=A0A834W4H4_9FABA|nr:Glutathione S-transferase U7 [Senna tora]
MEEEVKGSSYSCRIDVILKLKGIQYESETWKNNPMLSQDLEAKAKSLF